MGGMRRWGSLGSQRLGSQAGPIKGQPRVLVLDPQIDQAFPSPTSLLNPNEVTAMRENQIQREGEEEDDDEEGEDTQTGKGHQTRSLFLAAPQLRGAWC